MARISLAQNLSPNRPQPTSQPRWVSSTMPQISTAILEVSLRSRTGFSPFTQPCRKQTLILVFAIRYGLQSLESVAGIRGFRMEGCHP